MMFAALGLLAIAAVAWVMSPIVMGDSDAGTAASRNLSPEAGTDDAGETLIRKWRDRRNACPSCGAKPETDAKYCSSCGRDLR